MPIIYPLREVPVNERDDIGVPFALRKLPNNTVGEQVIRLKARLKHYGVKNIFNANTIADLIAQRDIHNAIIQRAQQRIDATPRVPQIARMGFVVGEYRYSNWVPYPHIEFDPRVPYKHVVKARSVDGRLKFSICNETLDGIAIGPLSYTPVLVHHRSIIPLEKRLDSNGNIDMLTIEREVGNMLDLDS